jgi:hypothetical protein
VLAILLVQGDSLDRAYLRHWADILNVRDLLERAIAGERAPTGHDRASSEDPTPTQDRLFE